MKVKSRNMLRVPGWFNQEKKAVRSKITHKIYRSFAPVLISIKISNTRIIGPKIELPFNQFAIWLMREQIVTGPIWRPSHPSRVRGLKWVSSSSTWSCPQPVAPFTGAWIEMDKHMRQRLFRIMSHPSRVRGLKLKPRGMKPSMAAGRTLHGCVDWNDDSVSFSVEVWPVAPFTGAWIEMSTMTTRRTTWAESHPSRVRGLKYSL